MLGQANFPGGQRDDLCVLPHFALWADFQTLLITTKEIRAGIARISKYAQHTSVIELSPHQFADPRSLTDPRGEAQPALTESAHHSTGTAGFPEEAKHQVHRAPHFFIRIKDNTALLVVVKPDGQWATQLALFGFVELAALQALV